MKRISHDLAGATQRITKLGDAMNMAISEVQEVWKDEMGRAFLQRHTAEIAPSIGQVVASLGETIELVERIAKKIQEPDRA